jgi:hypothetical protein
MSGAECEEGCWAEGEGDKPHAPPGRRTTARAVAPGFGPALDRDDVRSTALPTPGAMLFATRGFELWHSHRKVKAYRAR